MFLPFVCGFRLLCDCQFARENNSLLIIWFTFLLQTYVNLKEYDNTLYANIEDLAAEWLFYRLTWPIKTLLFE